MWSGQLMVPLISDCSMSSWELCSLSQGLLLIDQHDNLGKPGLTFPVRSMIWSGQQDILGIDEVQFLSGFSVLAHLIQNLGSGVFTNFGHDIVQETVFWPTIWQTVLGIICSYLDGSTLDKYICFLCPKNIAISLYIISCYAAQS